MNDDNELISRYVHFRDPADWEALYRKWQPILVTTLGAKFEILRSRDCEDIVQNLLIKVFTGPETFSKGHFGATLHTAAHNAALSFIERQKRISYNDEGMEEIPEMTATRTDELPLDSVIEAIRRVRGITEDDITVIRSLVDGDHFRVAENGGIRPDYSAASNSKGYSNSALYMRFSRIKHRVKSHYIAFPALIDMVKRIAGDILGALVGRHPGTAFAALLGLLVGINIILMRNGDRRHAETTRPIESAPTFGKAGATSPTTIMIGTVTSTSPQPSLIIATSNSSIPSTGMPASAPKTIVRSAIPPTPRVGGSVTSAYHIVLDNPSIVQAISDWNDKYHVQKEVVHADEHYYDSLKMRLGPLNKSHLPGSTVESLILSYRLNRAGDSRRSSPEDRYDVVGVAERYLHDFMITMSANGGKAVDSNESVVVSESRDASNRMLRFWRDVRQVQIKRLEVYDMFSCLVFTAYIKDEQRGQLIGQLGCVVLSEISKVADRRVWDVERLVLFPEMDGAELMQSQER